METVNILNVKEKVFKPNHEITYELVPIKAIKEFNTEVIDLGLVDKEYIKNEVREKLIQTILKSDLLEFQEKKSPYIDGIGIMSVSIKLPMHKDLIEKKKLEDELEVCKSKLISLEKKSEQVKTYKTKLEKIACFVCLTSALLVGYQIIF